MGIVVDPPLLVHVLNKNSALHAKYSPVNKWVLEGSAKIVVGGLKFQKEMKGLVSILPLLSNLERKGKIYRVDTDEVENEVSLILNIENSKDFDDPHLIALVRLSQVKLICIEDPRAHKYLRRSDFYWNEKNRRPKLYTRFKNKTLLNKENLCGVCYR